MTRPLVLAVLVATLMPVQSSARQAQVPPNQPGMPTIARMVVVNQGRPEAIPVAIHASEDVLPVAVISAPALTLAAGATTGTRVVRQAWEYRHVQFKSGEDLGAGLAQAGTDGWEAVGMSSAGAGGMQVLLKRPK